jgi:ribosomal-protein-alanine N-acetyltransferase
MTREQAHNRLDIERENRLGVQYWPMFLRETGEFVGCAGLRQWQMDPKMIEAGVHLMRSSWGLRLGEEALRAVLAYGFETLGLPTIVAGMGSDTTTREAVRERGFCLYAQHHVGAESDRSTHVRDQCGDVAFDRGGERERLSA